VAANSTEVAATNDTANVAAVDANAMPAQPAPEAAPAPTEPAPAAAPEKQSFPWGVLGLLGLVGLFGKRRRSS
jgi:MYXO-CTERM domain-containing protein